MGSFEDDQSHRKRVRDGSLTGAKPPLRQKHVWAIRTKLQIEQRTRDLAMFNLAIDSKLRGCDVVALKVEDVAPNGYSVDRATVRQKKTGRPVRFELTEQTRQAVDDYIRAASKKPGEFLFTACRRQERGMSTRQYARLLSEWIASIGLDPHLFGTHSLRRTKATLIYRRTGNLRAVQLLLGHTKIESTVRYLGIEVDDALSIAEQVDLWICPGGADTFRPCVSSAHHASRHYWAAKRNSRTSSKICRKAGSGARHMVRYVSRKGSRLPVLSCSQASAPSQKLMIYYGDIWQLCP